MANQSINIIGAGAMGHLWACYLKRQGYLADLYTRQSQANRTVLLKNSNANFSLNFNYTPIEQWKSAPVTIVCVKAHQLESLCKSLPSHAFKDKLVILMMNGLGLVEIIHQYFPYADVLQAYTSQGVYLSVKKTQLNKSIGNITANASINDNQTLQVNHTGNGETYLGYNDLESPNLKWKKVLQMLNLALPPTQWHQSQKELLLVKLIINAIINPLTALYNCTNGGILINGQLSPQANALLEEIKPIIRAELPHRRLRDIKSKIEAVAQSTANNFSSMQQDIAHKNKTEIDFINGHLVKIAHKLGFSLTKHNEIIQQIKML